MQYILCTVSIKTRNYGDTSENPQLHKLARPDLGNI